MRLLSFNGNRLTFTKDLVSDCPPYAILSHTWGNDDDEVTFSDVIAGKGSEKPGYRKIQFCARQAASDGLSFFWIDTCCIDKSNSTELQREINSMFRFYKDSAKCYVFLSDVNKQRDAGQPSSSSWESCFRASRWFTRGWTLQELLAPLEVGFYSVEGIHLGGKKSLEQEIHEITRIPVNVLRGSQLSQVPIAERMSWTEGRFTKYPEDKAYSLLGIFGVYIPLIYGEGAENAFARLRRAISDHDAIKDYHPKETCDRVLGWLPYIDQQRFYWEAQSVKKLDAGTGNWFLNWPLYEWTRQNSLLWLYGKAGSGKTIMTSSVIEHLGKLRTATVAYYYFSFQNRDSQNLRSLICALLVQMVKKLSLPHPANPDVFFIPGAFKKVYDAHFPSKTPSMEELESSLVEVIGLSEKTFIVVDALDECDSQMIRNETLTFLSNLMGRVETKVYVMVTSRQEVDIKTKVAQLPIPTTSVALGARAVDRDIINHLRAVLKEDSFSSWSNALKTKVTDHLVQRADGVFRWADLQLQGLRGKSREVDVNRALKRLPRDLGETYSRMLQRIDANNYRLEAMAALRWLACAARPLSLAELAELAVFDVEESDQANLTPSSKEYQVSFVRENRFSSASEVLHILSGLITSTKEADCRGPRNKRLEVYHTIVSFSHFSVKEYLQSANPMPPSFQLGLNECHWFVLKCCLAYLSGYDLEKKDNGPSEKYDLLLYACFSVWYHVHELDIFHITDHRGEPIFNSVMAAYLDVPGYATTAALDKILFQCGPVDDVSRFIHRKIDISKTISPDVARLICYYEDRGPRSKQSVQQFREATVIGDLSLANLLLDSNVRAPANILITVMKGPSNIKVQFRWADTEYPLTNPSLTGDTVEDTVNATDTEAPTSPHLPPTLRLTGTAANENRMAMWKLLQSQPQVGLNARDMEGRTPLLLAAMHGDEVFFNYLWTQNGIETDVQEVHGWDLLNYALLGRNTNIIKSILDSRKFDLDHQDLYGRTTLEWSIQLGLYMLLAPTSQFCGVSYQAPEGRQVRFIPIKEVETGGEVWSCAFSRDGSRLVLCLSSNTARVYDLEKHEFQSDLRHEGAVTDAAWSPDDSMILTLGLAGTTRLWNSKTGELIKDLPLHHEGGYRCHWSPDGTFVIIISLSKEIGIVTMAISDGQYHSWFTEDQNLRVHCSALSKDGKWFVAIAGESCRLLIYEVEHEKLTASILTRERPTWLSISDNLSLIVVGFMDGGFETRVLPSGEFVWRRPGIMESDYLLQGSAGGVADAFLLRPEENGYISTWDLRSSTFIGLNVGHYPSRTNTATWNPANPNMFASGGDDGRFRIWSCENMPDDNE